MNRYWKIKDFHGARSLGVGSSDVPTLAGLTRQWGGTTLSLWEQKTGRVEGFKGNSRTYWGHRLEGLVLAEFIRRRYGDAAAEKFLSEKRRGRSYGPFKTETEARHPDRNYCISHADLLLDGNIPQLIADAPDTPAGEPYIVEAKTAGMMSGKRREGEIFSGYDPDDLSAQGIPDAVYLQVQHQLFTYGVRFAYVAVLIDTGDYREYGPIVADPRVQEKILALAERFWIHIQDDTPPAPETWDDVVRLYPHQTGETAVVGGEQEAEVLAMIAENIEIKARIKKLEQRQKDIKNAIGILVGENAVLATADGKVLAKSSERSREFVSLPKDDQELEDRMRAAGLVKLSSWREVRY